MKKRKFMKRFLSGLLMMLCCAGIPDHVLAAKITNQQWKDELHKTAYNDGVMTPETVGGNPTHGGNIRGNAQRGGAVTGDTRYLWRLVVVMGGFAAVCIAAIVLRRKKRHRQEK